MNVFNHPFDALVSLIRGIADFALDSLNVVAKTIDKIDTDELNKSIQALQRAVDPLIRLINALGGGGN